MADLRLHTEDFNSWRITDQWVEGCGIFGLPRAYAWRKGIQPEVVCPECEFPEVSVEYRYNQEEVVKKAVQFLTKTGGVLIEAGTGFGKSKVSCLIAGKLGTPTLILVHKTDLLDRWKKECFDTFGFEAGHIQGDIWDIRQITVATVQTLYSRLEDIQKIADDFGFVICDEGHRFPGEMFTTVISHLPAKYRMAVSATWRRKDGLEPLWFNHISDKIVSGVKKDLEVVYRPLAFRGMDDRQFYHRGDISHTKCLTVIAEDSAYNDFCAGVIAEMVKKGKNILAITHRLSQISEIRDRLKKAGIASGVYVGKYRGKILKSEDLEKAIEHQVILGTFGKISEGSDIPKLDTLILLTPCSDPEQAVGRICRKYPGKTRAVVLDLFPATGYNYALAKKRQRIYEKLGIKRV